MVTAESKNERVSKISNTEFHISVRERAARNAVNKRVCELIAREFDTTVAKVRLLTGHRSRVKIVEVEL